MASVHSQAPQGPSSGRSIIHFAPRKSLNPEICRSAGAGKLSDFPHSHLFDTTRSRGLIAEGIATTGSTPASEQGRSGKMRWGRGDVFRRQTEQSFAEGRLIRRDHGPPRHSGTLSHTAASGQSRPGHSFFSGPACRLHAPCVSNGPASTGWAWTGHHRPGSGHHAVVGKSQVAGIGGH